MKFYYIEKDVFIYFHIQVFFKKHQNNKTQNPQNNG